MSNAAIFDAEYGDQAHHGVPRDGKTLVWGLEVNLELLQSKNSDEANLLNKHAELLMELLTPGTTLVAVRPDFACGACRETTKLKAKAGLAVPSVRGWCVVIAKPASAEEQESLKDPKFEFRGTFADKTVMRDMQAFVVVGVCVVCRLRRRGCSLVTGSSSVGGPGAAPKAKRTGLIIHASKVSAAQSFLEAVDYLINDARKREAEVNPAMSVKEADERRRGLECARILAGFVADGFKLTGSAVNATARPPPPRQDRRNDVQRLQDLVADVMATLAEDGGGEH